MRCRLVPRLRPTRATRRRFHTVSTPSASGLHTWVLCCTALYAAVEAYDYGLNVLDRLYRTQLGRRHKEAWLREAQRVPVRAAYARAEQGNLEAAVTVLEQGRALLLSEALERDQARLDHLTELGYDVLAQRYREAANLLGGMDRAYGGVAELTSPPPLQRHADLQAAKDELQAVISEIRAVEGYERFLDPPNFADVAVAAAAAPLAYLAATKAGGLGLIVTADAAVTRVPLPELTVASLQREVSEYFGAYSGRYSDPDAWLAALDKLTRWLWDCVMEPVLATAAPLPGSSSSQPVCSPFSRCTQPGWKTIADLRDGATPWTIPCTPTPRTPGQSQPPLGARRPFPWTAC